MAAICRIALTFLLFVNLSISVEAQGEVEAMGKVSKLKWVLECRDDSLYRLIDETKGEPPEEKTGRSGRTLWCELIVNATQGGGSQSYYRLGLFFEANENIFRIEGVDLREVRVSENAYEDINYGEVISPRLVNAVLEKAGGMMLRGCDVRIAGAPNFMRNYAFQLNWDNDIEYSKIDALVDVPKPISDSFWAEREWARATISPKKLDQPPWQIHLLRGRKFRVFQYDRQTEKFVHFGEFESEIWNDIVNEMVVRSPEVAEEYDHHSEISTISGLKVTTAMLAPAGKASSGEGIVTVVENTSDTPKAMLLWDTPFDLKVGGRAFDVFEVKGGERRKLMYKGSEIDREVPSADDCVVIPPGQSIAALLDIRKTYEISSDFGYELHHNFDLITYRMVKGKVDVRQPKNAVKMVGATVVLRQLQK